LAKWPQTTTFDSKTSYSFELFGIVHADKMSNGDDHIQRNAPCSRLADCAADRAATNDSAVNLIQTGTGAAATPQKVVDRLPKHLPVSPAEILMLVELLGSDLDAVMTSRMKV
jgi:hypothetical protein